jgi:hypothetical protein
MLLFSSTMRQELLDEICVLCNGSARDFEESAGKLTAFWGIQGILDFLEKLFEGNTSDMTMR